MVNYNRLAHIMFNFFGFSRKALFTTFFGLVLTGCGGQEELQEEFSPPAELIPPPVKPPVVNPTNPNNPDPTNPTNPTNPDIPSHTNWSDGSWGDLTWT